MAERPIFDETMITAWNEALETERPDLLLEADLSLMPNVLSFTPQTTQAGLVLSLGLRRGVPFRFFINAVAAQHLAKCIIAQGKEAGWLDEKLEVVSPTFQLNS